MVLWAANFIVVKAAVGALPPVGFTFLRFILAAITLMLLLRWREGASACRAGTSSRCSPGRPRVRRLPDTLDGRPTTVAAGDSALIIAATPVLVAVLAVVAGSDVLTPVKLRGALISFAGVAIIVASGQG